MKVIIVEPEGGFDETRLQMALRMLVSEKDFIDYFRHLHAASKPPGHQSLRLKERMPPEHSAAIQQDNRALG